MADMTPEEKQKAIYDGGVADSMDEAAHFLYDAGDIEEDEWLDLLSEKERERLGY